MQPGGERPARVFARDPCILAGQNHLWTGAGGGILVLVGSIGMAVTLGLMALAFSYGTLDAAGAVTLPDPWATIALICANAFVVFFGATWGPLVWVLLGEMFPNSIRAGALAVAAAAQWAANFFISTTFPAFAEIGLTFAYSFYAFFALLSFFFVLRFVPETKGRELEEMTEEVIVQRRGRPART